MKFTKLFIFCFLSILFSVYTQAQDVTVSGKVYDENGLPIPGVSILIKGTSKATASDFDGNYQIKALSKETLVFNYLGYTSIQEVINGRNRIDVKLRVSEQSLQEVVVVGYGTQKKSVVTGAISSVKAKDLEKVPNGRIEQALQGRVSGVTIAASSGQPGSSSTIRIRGVTTFGGGNDPLWVVDGVVVDAGGIGFLNQSDIESIEVLKDAASAAIYGTRAATGVILVTTKKGKSGKITVNYNGFSGISAPEKTLHLLNATQYGALLNEKSVAAGGPVVFPNLAVLGVGTDWQKAIFNTSAFRYSHELSISGGSDVSNFYASFGIQDQEGIVSTEISNYTKKNFRLNSTHKLSKVFTFGQTFGFSRQKTVGIGNTNSEFGGPLSSAINLDPTTPIIETDPVKINNAPYSTNPVIRDANGNPYGISSLVGQEMTNPLAYAKTRLGGYGMSDDIVGNAYFEAAVSKHIKVRSTIGGKLSSWGGQGFTPVFYLSATSNVLKNSYGKNENKSFAWNVENIVTYANQFGNHNLTVLLGQGSYVDNIGGGSSSTMFGLPIGDYRDASFNFDVPQSNRSSGTYDLTEHKLTSLFSRVNYDYKEKYLFTGIIRRDGSSRFGANNKFGVFPSFNLGWVVTKEDFWKENNVLNTLKVRGGYGVVGNDAIPNFRYLSLVEGGYNYSFGNTGAITTGYSNLTLDNPDLRWEETAQTNIGFESRFFNTVNLTVDLYKKSTTGILRPINIPGYVGVGANPTGNVADMDNKGIEVELGYKKKFGEVNFSVNGNIAYLKNTVTFIAADSNYITGDASFQSMGPVTRTQVGQSYNSFYGFKTAGIFQNQAEIAAYTNVAGGLIQPNARPGDFRWVDTDGNGAIGDADKQFLGSNIPKYTYGLTLNLDYKNFDFMAFMQGAAGNKIFQGLRRLDVSNANYQTIALSRWTGEGTSNQYPRLTNDDTNDNFAKMSDFYLEKGDYLRLKLVQVGYSLPSDVISKIGASKIRFYLTAENLLTITKYTGYDPEIGGGVFGIDKGIYPQARTFMLGANLQF
ncbi:SusC/RagA family TonB-linked outer membrane protein [Flavobacterium urumqiense]|uniref:TonB-linked outer membrane protein, SusC/RagA family n=1 Tax=Flavobacterium urumqiense TaxID=935224 RepID=A0A1H5YCM7_9FLAO|nr:TonB-dependent receptor [Flavobacterium urumqiense]SEG21522.1 TonB-linked outer membrane protein, SusC/RagA family [Flavobacterium urumqiense]